MGNINWRLMYFLAEELLALALDEAASSLLQFMGR